jgi:hypothetical protein
MCFSIKRVWETLVCDNKKILVCSHMEKIMNSEEDKNVRNDIVTIYEKMRNKICK